MIKVAAYCRVSTDKDDQANSFEAQQQYFREYVGMQPDWELYAIYADEGITGTSTRKRTQFNRMISDAHAGKFSLILTKEVSRFSRNILDTISHTRELKSLGIGVIFVNDRINTLDPEAEMMLAILATLAQEESRKTSSRVVWGQTRQMEKGIAFGHSLLGYDVRNGRMSINPAEAEIVRLIFQKYAVEQVGTSKIAEYLTDHEYQTGGGSTKWSAGTVIKILKNEKYVGDLVQKKTYTPDYLSHSKKRNCGQVPLIVCRDHHEPIVSREIWNMTQHRLMMNRKKADSGHSNRYIFSGKIICGECGSRFVGRTKYLANGERIRRWSCGSVVSAGTKACHVGKLIRDDDAVAMLKTTVPMLYLDEIPVIQNVVAIATDAVGLKCADEDRCIEQMSFLQHKIEKLMDAYLGGVISSDEFSMMKKKYDEQLCSKQRLLEENKEREKQKIKSADIAGRLEGILRGKIESEVFYKSILDSLTVYKSRQMELRLKHLPHVFRFVG